MNRLTLSAQQWSILVVLVIVLIVSAGGTYWLVREQPGPSPLTEQLLSVPEEEGVVFVDRVGNPVDPITLVSPEQVVIVNSWASWSPYAARELPLLAEVARERGRAVRVIAINRDEPVTRMEAYLSTLGDLSGIDFILDQNDYYYQQTGGYAMPETLIYNRAGAIHVHKRGELSKAEIDQYLDQLLTGGDN